MKHRAALTSALVLFLASPANGAESVKKWIIEDCPKALEAFKNLSPKKQDEYIPYLGLVLKLQTSNPFESSIDSSAFIKKNPLSPPIDELGESEVWKSFQPTREMEAKRCAIELLRGMSPRSFDAVPDLISLAEIKTLDSDLKEMLSEVMISITVAAKKDPKYTISEQTLRRIADLPGGENHFYSENIVIELEERMIPFLIEEMKKPDAAHRESLTKILLRLDPDGEKIGSGVLSLLESGDDGLRKRALLILARLPHYYPKSFRAIVGRLQDLSPEIQEEAVRTVQRASKDAEQEFKPDGKSAEALTDALGTVTPTLRDSLQIAVERFGPAGGSYEAILTGFVGRTDRDLRGRALLLLGKYSSLSPEGYGLLTKSAVSDEGEIQLRAIEGLGFQKGRRGETYATYGKVMKAASTIKESNRRRRIIETISGGINRLGYEKGMGRLASSIIEGLGFTDTREKVGENAFLEDPVAKALVTIGKESTPHLVSALKSSDSLLRARAAIVLGELRAQDPGALQTLAGLLKDGSQGVREGAERALVKIGDSSESQMRKLVKNGSADVKLGAARVLYSISKGDPSLVPILIDGAKRASCSEKSSYVERAAKIQKGASPQLIDLLVACLPEVKSQDGGLVEALSSIGPLKEAPLATTVDLLKGERLDKTIRIRLLDQWKKIGIPTDDLITILIQLLRDPDNSVRYFGVNTLSTLGDVAKPAVPELLKMKDDGGVEPLLQNEAALAVVKIDPGAFDFTTYFLDELKDKRAPWAAKSLKKLGAKFTVPILDRALTEVPEAALEPVLDVAGSFEEESMPLIPKITPLLSSRLESVRIRALIAAMKIKPDAPELVPVLRRELITENRIVIMNETFGPKLVPILNKLSKEAGSRSEGLALGELRTQIESNRSKRD